MQFYKEALHCIDEIVLFYNKSGRIESWNAKTMCELYYDKDDLANITIADLFSTSELDFMNYIKSNQSKCEFEASVYRKNGTCFRAKITNHLFEDDEFHGMCIIKNIEEIKRLEEKLSQMKIELEEAKSAKNSFLANVTHELRTPLNGMKGMAELLLESELSSEQKDTIQIMMTCYDNMQQIINAVLDYSKLAAGKMQLEEREFELSSWLSELAQVHKLLIEKKNLYFELHIQKGIPMHLAGDTLRLAQVINNLMNNAIKFTSQGKIVLECNMLKEDEQQVQLLFSVSDTGIGIEKEKRGQLFQSFVQLDPSITRRYGGTGLGLSICKEIVSLMGGMIDVESNGLKGSRFFFTVTLRKGKMQETAASVLEQAELVREDDESERVIAITQEYDLNELLKQLSICVDLDSYEKAEEIVHVLKEQTKTEYPAISKTAFRLELALRKQNDEKIKTQYIELCKLCKVW